jgi:hypothetical protein
MNVNVFWVLAAMSFASKIPIEQSDAPYAKYIPSALLPLVNYHKTNM